MLAPPPADSQARPDTAIQADLLTKVPVELQRHIISFLPRRSDLQAFGRCSRPCYDLVSERLFSIVSFDPLTPDDCIKAYLEDTAPRWGRYCRTLDIGFSLGPLVDRKADEQRAWLFSRILGYCLRVRSLTINTAGSHLRDLGIAFTAVACSELPFLTSLTLKVYDVDSQEVDCLASFFKDLAKNARSFPSLRHLNLEGSWTLTSRQGDPMSKIFRAMREALRALPLLESLRLAYHTVSAKDLSALLTGTRLHELQLLELPELVLSDLIAILSQAGLVETLQRLTFVQDLDSELPARPPMSGKSTQSVVFHSLTYLSISFRRYYTSTLLCSGYEPFYSYLLSLSPARTAFPKLLALDMGDALTYTPELSVRLAQLILVAKGKKLMPALTHVLVGEPPCGHLHLHPIQPVMALLAGSGICLAGPEGPLSRRPSRTLLPIRILGANDKSDVSSMTAQEEALLALITAFGGRLFE